MPDPRPPYLPGQYYHFYNRGHSRASIFREDANYLFVLRKLKAYVGELNVALVAYCLMPNHYHFLVRQDGEQGVGLLPQRVFNSYTKAYNKRYAHSGTLFEGSYEVKPVNEQKHLLHLCRYIHVNPVKDGFVATPTDWPYSNYQEWVGLRAGTLVDQAFIQAHFPTPEHYATFVLDYLKTRQLPQGMKEYLEKLEP